TSKASTPGKKPRRNAQMSYAARQVPRLACAHHPQRPVVPSQGIGKDVGRRRAMKFLCACLLCAVTALGQTEQWGIFEISLPGPTNGNPFVDVQFSATFGSNSVTGFYDGDGTYRVRFMPDHTGDWTYTTHSNRQELEGKTGKFTVTAPS